MKGVSYLIQIIAFKMIYRKKLAMDIDDMPRTEVVMEGEPTRIDSDYEIETEYVGFEEIQPCSSIDEEKLVSVMPKFAEFNEKVDMKNPIFKI